MTTRNNKGIKISGQGINAIRGACLYLGTKDPVAREHYLNQSVESGAIQISGARS